MRRNRPLFLKAAFLAGALALCVLPCDAARAEESPESSDLLVTQAWMREALNKMETRLSTIEENQQKILDGQTKLSEEHTQLRYWVHRS